MRGAGKPECGRSLGAAHGRWRQRSSRRRDQNKCNDHCVPLTQATDPPLPSLETVCGSASSRVRSAVFASMPCWCSQQVTRDHLHLSYSGCSIARRWITASSAATAIVPSEHQP